MSKTYYTSGTGAQQTLANAQDEKIPIYDNETALDNDLANLKVGQIVGTKSGHDDVIDQMKAYIRSYNEITESLYLVNTNAPDQGWTTYLNVTQDYTMAHNGRVQIITNNNQIDYTFTYNDGSTQVIHAPSIHSGFNTLVKNLHKGEKFKVSTTSYDVRYIIDYYGNQD